MLGVVAQEVAVARYLVVYLRRGGNDPQLAPWLEGRKSHPSRHSMGGGCGGRRAGARLVGAGTDAVAATSARNLSRLFNEDMIVTDFVNRMRMGHRENW